ncbi:hypothetical protein SCLCIDRAFT_608317 [Scleroderma citrinum Foug A]|uniref:Uncharacterized protein n=1 Tax=Scleroderma citrinum Foug A TaxID=1036808 RepID=A0A0C2ZSN2_9AGAM|nr:hypothetical protein SCLCIDRAFT_608317 [Scleroderma citrinum Foug A]
MSQSAHALIRFSHLHPRELMSSQAMPNANNAMPGSRLRSTYVFGANRKRGVSPVCPTTSVIKGSHKLAYNYTYTNMQILHQKKSSFPYADQRLERNRFSSTL